MDPIASNGTDLIDLLCECFERSGGVLLTRLAAHRTGLPRHDGVYAYAPPISFFLADDLPILPGKTKTRTS
jgi:hypothetical protein